VRLSWWNSNNTSWKKAALSVPNLDQLPNGKLPENLLDEIYHSDAKPVLVGHYKMKGKPKIQSSNASSLDFPSHSCVYQWAGETELTNKNLVLHI
jgi:hypothetical protein